MEREIEFKKKIVDFINDNLSEGEEPYTVLDLFYFPKNNSGRLNFCGFRLLKRHYDFFYTEFNFEETPYNILCLTKSIKGLYYIYGTPTDEGKLRIQTTDTKFVNRMKIIGDDFESIKKEFLRKKSS